MKQTFDKIFFYIFTFILILFIYFYFFQKKVYYTYMNKIFNKEEIEQKDNEYNKLFYSYIFYYIAYFMIAPFCKRNIYKISQLYYKNYEQRKLHDLLHNIIPYHKYSGILSEIFTLFIILSITYFYIYNPNIQILYSILILLGIMCISKCIIGLLTLLPDSSGNCTYSDYMGSCNDLLFSGHVSKIFILLLLCDYYNLIPNYISNIYYILFGIIILFILSSRKHYSIDIIFGIIMALFIYMIYYHKNIF